MFPLLYPLLSQPWAGMAVGAGVAVIGFLLAVGLRRLQPAPRSLWSRGGTLVVLAAGASSAVLLWGGITSFIDISRLAFDHPPPGTLVDVGGYHMHVLAEGDAGDGPTVIWIPGGHGQGLALYHLHAAIRDETRSILFDRPGTGWSDPGPEQCAQWRTFYRDWPEEDVAAAITCPRLALIGSSAETAVAGIPLRLVERLREARPRLEAMGWMVREIPGAETAAILDPAVMVPEMRGFLEDAQ